MDKIWDRKYFEVRVHWPLWRGWKNEWLRRTDKSRTLKKERSICYFSWEAFFNLDIQVHVPATSMVRYWCSSLILQHLIHHTAMGNDHSNHEIVIMYQYFQTSHIITAFYHHCMWYKIMIRFLLDKKLLYYLLLKCLFVAFPTNLSFNFMRLFGAEGRVPDL